MIVGTKLCKYVLAARAFQAGTDIVWEVRRATSGLFMTVASAIEKPYHDGEDLVELTDNDLKDILIRDILRI
jgi:hypothetical protein